MMAPDVSQELKDKYEALIQKTEFQRDLQKLINRYSQENYSGTPDFILAQFIQNSLNAFNLAVNEREKWYGREQDSRFGTPLKAFGDPTREPGETPRMIKDIPQA